MNRTRALPGLRLFMAVAALAALGLCAGAAMPGPAGAHDDDDDNGGNGGGVYHQCTGGTKEADTATDQWCVITKPTGTCIQRSDAPEVRQRCTFTQSSPYPAVMGTATTLRATAIQTHNPEGGPNGTQDAFQVIEVSQTNLSPGKWAILNAKQIADQCLGAGDNFEDEDGDWNDEDDDGDRDDDGACEDGDEEDGDDEEDDEDENGPFFPTTIMQSQRATQTIDAFQKTVGTGKDEAYALQVQKLHERAANADVIEQDQNFVQRDNECGQLAGALLVDTEDANACFSIKQQSDSSKLSKLEQVYDLFQSARNTMGAGFQEQGDPAEFFGGLNHGFDQTGLDTGTPRQVSNQDEELTLRREDTPLMNWHSFAGPRKDIGLQDDANGRAHMTQDVEMSSTGPGVGSQGAFLEIDCESIGPGGNCTGVQRAETNDDTYEDTDSGPFIFMVARCQDNEGVNECVDVSD